MSRAVLLADAAATAAFGAALARALDGLDGPCVLALEGELGAGKTTLTRGLLRALGERGTVRSPTYTLIESYACPDRQVHHLDLYRLRDSEGIAGLGLRDLFEPRALLIIEWPERDAALRARADLVVKLACDGDGRRADCHAQHPLGEVWLGRVVFDTPGVAPIS
jgi:tRNA threonylcarbamoyladenosine biosynthesis protein TsaE